MGQIVAILPRVTSKIRRYYVALIILIREGDDGINCFYTYLRSGVYEAIRARCKEECRELGGGRLCMYINTPWE